MKAFLLTFCLFFCGFVSSQTDNSIDMHYVDDESVLQESLMFRSQSPKNSVLVIIYMAARNDLSIFVDRHIKQLQNLGSTEKVKLFAHLDIQKQGKDCYSKNFFIEKNRIMKIGADVPQDSGNEETLINTVRVAYNLFPADDVVLILWNHGTGPLEPTVHKTANPWEIWRFSGSNSLELDRSLPYLDYVSNGETSFAEPKGICFDDVTGGYLTTATLTHALSVITNDILKKKIKILACDACHMGCADVFIGFQPYAEYFVASQEVELGHGYKYDLLMEPLLQGRMGCNETFACHFTTAFKQFYNQKIDYYTHAAIELTNIHELENNIDELAQCMSFGLEHQKGKSVKEAIRLSRHKNNCTRFKEPTYIDYGHFLRNLLSQSVNCELNDAAMTIEFKKHIAQITSRGISLIKECVLANVTGDKYKHATGISIYFPEFVIHKSYLHNALATKTHWLRFLKLYVSASK